MSKTLDILRNLVWQLAELVEMARQGEIDPWEVRVGEAIDRHLDRLDLQLDMGLATPPPDGFHHDNLSQSGQMFLYAAMLVLLKSDSLQEEEEEEEFEDPLEEDEREIAAEAIAAFSALPRKLERYLRRRGVAPPQDRRQATLQEMLSQLQSMAQEMAQQPNKHFRERRSNRRARSDDLKALAALAQRENLAEIAHRLESFLGDRWLEIAGDAEWLSIDRLLEAWQPHPHPEVELETEDYRVEIFWALLTLCAQSKVELRQFEFYGSIELRWLPPEERSSASDIDAMPEVS